MGKMPSKSSDERMDKMVKALREDPSNEAPASLVGRVMMASKPQKTVMMPALRLGAAAAVVICGALIFWPRESPAAMLSRVVQAANANVFRHELTYKKNDKGQFVLWMESYAQGKRWHLIDREAGSELSGDGDRQIYLYKDQGYATSEVVDGSSPTMFGTPSLKRILSYRAGDRITVKPNVMWQGKRADLYLTEGTVTDAQGTVLKSKTTLYADAASDRPLYLEGSLEGFEDTATKWEYPDFDPKLLAVDMPKGTPVYDLTQQRQDALQVGDRDLGSQTVGGIHVVLRAVYVDHNGSILAVTTGGEGRLALASAGLEVEGLGVGEAQPGSFMDGHRASGGFVYEAVAFKGQRLVGEAAQYPRDTKFPDRFRISIPIWKATKTTDGGEGRELVGFAKFDVKNPTRTSMINSVLTPLNLSIFKSASEQKSSPVDNKITRSAH